MTTYAKTFSLRRTPQSEPIPGTIPNSAGGHAFAVDAWTRLDRFLVLGAEGGSYYASPRKLVRENAQGVLACLAEDGARTVARIVAVSEGGRAPKQDPAIFALALAAAAENAATRRAALVALPRVCRTGTHLFQFAEAVEAMRGWGPRPAAGGRRLVPGASPGRTGLPGGEVPLAPGLVAPRPPAPRSPGDG